LTERRAAIRPAGVAAAGRRRTTRPAGRHPGLAAAHPQGRRRAPAVWPRLPSHA